MNIDQHARLLRKNADELTAQIQGKTDPLTLELLKRIQVLLVALANQVEQDTLDPFLRKVTSVQAIKLLLLRDAMPDPGLDHENFVVLARAGLDVQSFPIAKEALNALTLPDPISASPIVPIRISATL